MATDSYKNMYLLLSIYYDRDSNRAALKFYDIEKGKIKIIKDNTGHKPYLLSDLSIEELINNQDIVKHKGFDHFEIVTKYDPLTDKKVKLTKVVARDPLSIGGVRNSIRELLKKHSWEARIKYHHCYTYDRGLIPGMLYRIENGDIKLVEYSPEKSVVEKISLVYKNEPDLIDEIKEWIKLFQTPVPDIRRIALDIEVYSPQVDRIPNPKEAKHPIIAVSLYSSDGIRKVLMLKRKNFDESELVDIDSFDIQIFESEKDLILETIKYLNEYPLVLTFNGDNFDLLYIRTRALKIGINEDLVPIEFSRDMEEARLKNTIHVDLYKFFNNRSMRIYAFGNRYRGGKTLDEISRALLGEGKVEHETPISQMTYGELALYSFRDAELTYKLTEFDDNLFIRLVLLLMRISKLSIDDLTRHNISAWIKSLMYFEHRKIGYLIPNPDELIRFKGKTTTKALIKGKKYLGAIVIDPVPGIFTNVTVVDFASLYPSVIKKWNLSYETVNCVHPECRKNRIPGTSHWVCTKRKGLTSKLIGFLRDLRVYIYKPLAKKELKPELRHQYKAVERALKVFINASYGVFGAETFPLYCPPVAECTAALGRYAIASTLKQTSELKIPVLYGDTDSLFLWNPEPEKIEMLIKWVADNLSIDLEIDKVYKWLALSERKKNYIGVYTDGEVDIKGLVGKKRNTPEFIKSLFYDIVSILRKAENIEDLEKAIEEIKILTRENYNKLKRKELSLDQLVFHVALSKPLSSYTKTTPQHVKAARQLEKLGKTIDVGDIITYVKVRSQDGVKAVQLARIDEIDQEKYVEHLKTTLVQILEALGISFDEILGSRHLEKFISGLV